MKDTKRILELKKEINNLLEERPELKEFQKDLEKKLKNAGTQQNRLLLLQELMICNLCDLKDRLQDLLIEINKLK